MTPNEVTQLRSTTADNIMHFIETWQKFKTAQTGRDNDYKGVALFTILDLLPTETVIQAIELYGLIHHPNDGRKYQ